MTKEMNDPCDDCLSYKESISELHEQVRRLTDAVRAWQDQVVLLIERRDRAIEALNRGMKYEIDNFDAVKINIQIALEHLNRGKTP